MKNVLTNNRRWAETHLEVSSYKLQILAYQININKMKIGQCISSKYTSRQSIQTDFSQFVGSGVE